MEPFTEGARDGSGDTGVGDVCLIRLVRVQRFLEGDRRGVDEGAPLEGAAWVAVIRDQSDNGAAVPALLRLANSIGAHADTLFREMCWA